MKYSSSKMTQLKRVFNSVEKDTLSIKTSIVNHLASGQGHIWAATAFLSGAIPTLIDLQILLCKEHKAHCSSRHAHMPTHILVCVWMSSSRKFKWKGKISVVLVSVGFSISTAKVHSLIQKIKRGHLKSGIVQEKLDTSATEKWVYFCPLFCWLKSWSF